MTPGVAELAARLEGLLGRAGFHVVPDGQPPRILATELAHLVLGHELPSPTPSTRRRRDAEAGAVAALVLEGWRSAALVAAGDQAAVRPQEDSGHPDPIERVFDASEAILGALRANPGAATLRLVA